MSHVDALRVGDLVTHVRDGLPSRGLVLSVADTVRVAGVTFEWGRMALHVREVSADALHMSAPAGTPHAARMALDLMHTPHATVADEVRAAWVANGEPR